MSKIDQINGRDHAERVYILLADFFKNQISKMVPAARRIQRFLFLPYCFFFLVNWKECTTPKHKVILDFLYIFFVLKSFPDNYYPCRLWTIPRSQWPLYYGSTYNPYQRGRLRRAVQPKQYEVIYEDKEICQSLCKVADIPIPKSLGVIPRGTDEKTFLSNAFDNHPETTMLIIKPNSGKGGHAIKIAVKDESGISYLKDGEKHPVLHQKADCEYIVQEFIKQHPELTRFSASTNTTRLVSLLTPDNEVKIVGTYIRFGTDQSLIDNLSKGGLAVPVDIKTGILGAKGFDRKGIQHERHPTSKLSFEGVPLPFWKELLALGAKVQKRLPYYKLLGMDIAITERGPVLIEINAIYDNIDLEQVCGPILKDEEVLQIFSHYDLLINNQQKKLIKDVSSAKLRRT